MNFEFAMEVIQVVGVLTSVVIIAVFFRLISQALKDLRKSP